MLFKLSTKPSQSPAYCIAFTATVLVTLVAALTPVLANTPPNPLKPDTALPAPAPNMLIALDTADEFPVFPTL